MTMFIIIYFNIHLDLPMLDCVGAQHPCRSCSINLSICMLRSVNQNLFFNFSKVPLASWMAYVSNFVVPVAYWEYLFDVGFLTGLAISIAVNAAMTSLIVFRILKVFRQVKTTSDDHILGITGGSTLWRIIFVLIESGMALLIIVLRMVTTLVNMEALSDTYPIIVCSIVVGFTDEMGLG